MLKFTYTENGVNLEWLTESLDEWVTTRVILALRAGIPMCLQPSTASFLLPNDWEILEELATIVAQEEGENLEVYTSTDDSIEITLRGTWIVSDLEQQEGIFVTMLDSDTEMLIFQLWLKAHVRVSVGIN
ncbi:alr0857 family protein [Gloeocapsa sp. PCC 73106]|uniref:alr0857 family protein n=1 Tax=Gloeocapsa sp. PCC 73106 TaxID=102232 RepID=UPI0002AC802A|nr:alr0857 family protein [Gloeocapsa sp. PCC 73106]ELR96293.1 hypothetical protein GLO73106DRAFT_00000820 [Gloeocapsa sp. PCC 73106]